MVNRGLSGYNSRWYLAVLSQLLDGIHPPHVSCVVICLGEIPVRIHIFMFTCVIFSVGANDCAHEDCPSGQHVPIEEYTENLKHIVSHLQGVGISKDRMVLVNPPVYYHDVFSSSAEHRIELKRSSESAEKYATACLMTAKELSVTCVDVHSAFKSDKRGKELLCDGLHLSSAGSQLFFDQIWERVEKKVATSQGSQSLMPNQPYWMDFRDTFIKC